LYFTHANVVVTYTDEDGNEIGSATDDDQKAESAEATVPEDTDKKVDEQPAEEAQAVSGSAVEAEQTGTAVTGGTVALVGVIGLVAGAFGGFVIANTRRRKLMK
jgi:hypothetical protein